MLSLLTANNAIVVLLVRGDDDLLDRACMRRNNLWSVNESHGHVNVMNEFPTILSVCILKKEKESCL